MPYSKFTFPEVVKEFSLVVDYDAVLFPFVSPVIPSRFLDEVIEEYVPLGMAIGTEKARSEFIIAPILAELRRQGDKEISLFSGIDFNVDPERGLSGFCDFLLSRSRDPYFVEAPVLAIIEAKNEDIRSGLGQCVASMVGAQLFNERAGNAPQATYGAVTTGTNWRFLRLDGLQVAVDRDETFWRPIERLLGVLSAMVAAPEAEGVL